VQGRVAAAVALVDVAAGIEHRGYDRRVAVERGPAERRVAVEGILARDRPWRGEPATNGGHVTGEDLRDGGLRGHRPLREPLQGRVERHDGRDRDPERQRDPHEPLSEQALEPAAAIDEHREVATEQEEEWHPEAVHGHQEQRQQIAAPRVVDGPGKLAEAQRGVQADPQQHREAAESVEIGAALCHAANQQRGANGMEARWYPFQNRRRSQLPMTNARETGLAVAAEGVTVSVPTAAATRGEKRCSWT